MHYILFNLCRYIHITWPLSHWTLVMYSPLQGYHFGIHICTFPIKSISSENASVWLDRFVDKTLLIRVMGYCRQATSRYPNQSQWWSATLYHIHISVIQNRTICKLRPCLAQKNNHPFQSHHMLLEYIYMMTSSSGNIFRVAGLLLGESTGHRWFSLPKASDMELCDWTIGWANNQDAGDLRRHCAHYDITVMTNTNRHYFWGGTLTAV